MPKTKLFRWKRPPLSPETREARRLYVKLSNRAWMLRSSMWRRFASAARAILELLDKEKRSERAVKEWHALRKKDERTPAFKQWRKERSAASRRARRRRRSK